MTKIVDPDLLTYIVNGVPTTENVQINTATKTIRLVAGGSLDAVDGVTGQCLFSKIKEIIRASAILISVPLPIREMIHDESMELINGWTLYDTASRNMVRDCGIAYIHATTLKPTAMFACFVSLGALAAGTTASDFYYTLSNSPSAAISSFANVVTGATYGVNELVQIYSDTNGDGTPDYDYRSYAKVFLRRQGYTYDEASNADIGYPALTYKKYNFPITHVVDAGVTKSDAVVDLYTGMSITWYAASQSASLGTNGPYGFHVIVDGNGHTHDEVYSWVQRQLRRSADIDADTGNAKTGQVTPALVFMDGTKLKTKLQPTGGVHVSNLAATSYNLIEEADDGGVFRTYPLSVPVLCEFDSYFQSDAASYFWVFKTSDYGTPSATPVLDTSSAQMKGAANVANASFAYNWTVDVPVTAVALGTAGAKIAIATGTITNTGTKLVFVGGQERWYANP